MTDTIATWIRPDPHRGGYVVSSRLRNHGPVYMAWIKETACFRCAADVDTGYIGKQIISLLKNDHGRSQPLCAVCMDEDDE